MAEQRPEFQRGGDLPSTGSSDRGSSAHSSSSRSPSSRSSSSRSAASRKRRRRSTSTTATKAAVYVVAVIGVSLILATLIWTWAGDVLALNRTPRDRIVTAVVTLPADMFTEREVTVETTGADGNPTQTTKKVYKADVGRVAGVLKDEGIIKYKTLFQIFVGVTGGDSKMAPGAYELNTDMDYRALISACSAGSASRSEISLTIREGYSLDQIFALLEENGVASVADLRDMAANHDYKFSFLEGLPLGDYHRLEGYLFPDTYRFFVGEDPLYALNKMLVNFDTMVTQDTRDQLAAEGRDLHQIITIASLIEKETDGEDQTQIASVIYNRLKNPDATGGYLQIDATLVYINGGNVPTEADKAIDSPYNTYLYKGLPAGPISNPGSQAIWAAMNPANTNYYYYALGTDGKHHYSRTFQEHQNFLASLPKD